VAHKLTSTVTGGIDLSRRTTGYFWVQGIDDPTVGGNPDSGYVSTNQITNNRGYFAQHVLGIHDRLFLTAAIRFEKNSNIGRQAGLITAPRAGLAYSWSVGDVAIKPRASFGTSLRPPGANQTAGTINQWYRQLPNPRLRPELQRGLDAGVDVDIGHGALSLEATYFNQHANDLISIVVIDTTGLPTYQYQNLGRVRNSGFELGVAAERGRASFRGSFTYTRNRVERLAADYAGTLRGGDELLYVARAAGGGTVSLRFPALARARHNREGVFEVGVTYIGTRTGADDLAAFKCYVISEDCRNERDYWTTHPGFAKLRTAVTYPLARQLTGFVNVDNLLNRQAFELFNYYPSRGRAILAGVRFGQ
jgi:outer membrane receptor protein involved in Fe transport